MTVDKIQANLTTDDIKKIYQLLKAFDKGLIINPSEAWELDHHDEHIVDRKGIKSVLKKIERLVPKEVEKINKIVLRRKYDTFNNEINELVYTKLERAFNEGRTVEIGYFNMNSAEVKKRKINVYHKTRKYVIGYCYLRNAMRKFRTSRIVSAKLTEKTYTIPSDFDKNKF